MSINSVNDILEELEDVNEDTMADKFLTFMVDKEIYALSIENIIEIIGVQHISDVPDMPIFVKGVINLRGKVVPVIDIRKRFGMEEIEYNDRTCIMVTTIKNITVGVIVDMVEEVRNISKEYIRPAPKVSTTANGKYLSGIAEVNKDVIIIVNLSTLLYDERLGFVVDDEEDEE